MGLNDPASVTPYIEVEGRGKRPLRFCRTVQDGHTATEQLAYQALWNYARRNGRTEADGSTLIDIGLSQLRSLLSTDHKNVKRLIASLQQKLALEVVRQPDYRLAIPTRYRIFNYTQILDRRRQAGLLWVVRTRTVRFVDPSVVTSLASEPPMDQSPMGIWDDEGQSPMGQSPQSPMGQRPKQPMGQSPVATFIKEYKQGSTAQDSTTTTEFPATLAANLNEWLTIDDAAVEQIWALCRQGTPDCTEEEVASFCRTKQDLCRSGRIDNPTGLLIRSIPQFFANGGSAALKDYRKEQLHQQERERQRERQAARMVLSDPESSPEEQKWAEDILRT